MDLLNGITKKLFLYRKFFLIVIFLLVLNLVYSFIFLSPAQQDSLAVPSLLAMLWLSLCYLLLVFSQKKSTYLEQILDTNPSLFNRIKIKLLRFFYLLLGLCFLLLTLTLSVLSFRLLNAWL